MNSRDRGEIRVEATEVEGRVRVTTLVGDQLVDAVLCSNGLAGGHDARFMGSVDLVISCRPFRIEVRQGVVVVALSDGRRVDVPTGATLVGERQADGSTAWWTEAGSAAVLRGSQSLLFLRSPAAPMVVGNSPL